MFLDRLPYCCIYGISHKTTRQPKTIIKDIATHFACNETSPNHSWCWLSPSAHDKAQQKQLILSLLSTKEKVHSLAFIVRICYAFFFSSSHSILLSLPEDIFLCIFNSQFLLYLVAFHLHKKFNPQLRSYRITCRLLYNSFLSFFQFSTPPSSTFSWA